MILGNMVFMKAVNVICCTFYVSLSGPYVSGVP